MNFFNIALCVALAVVFVVGKTSADHAACLDKNGLSQDEFDSIVKKLEDGAEDADTKFKCYTHCMMESDGLIDGSGKFDVSSLDDGEDKDEAEKCKKEYDGVSDKCEYAFKLSNCYFKHE
ncbi:general odorant-binding protein 57c-like [Musca domestica]|uniref:General odorant-binding protein 57c-like n=1 Tax=Musca domestica TaxID=7370 RepID=A0A1I8MFV2_MUSDO|nr:general odorant-binding protein 57c-like [Musca domestica]